MPTKGRKNPDENSGLEREHTTRELRREILRLLREEINPAIEKYKEWVAEGGQESPVYERYIERAREATAYFNPRTGKVVIPEGRFGELAAGTSYKRKAELLREYDVFRRFLQMTDKAEPEEYIKGWNEKTEAFNFNHNSDLTTDEYMRFVDVVNSIRNSWVYKYLQRETPGGLSEVYANASTTGRRKILPVITNIMKDPQAYGTTPDDLMAYIAKEVSGKGV